MTQQNPSPRAAANAFTNGGMNQTGVNGLTELINNGGIPWDAEDSLFAYSHLSATDRPSWISYETALAGASDAESALASAELIAGGASQGNPPVPAGGTIDEVAAVWYTHALTASSRRVRVRALSRIVSGSEYPSVVLDSLFSDLE